MSNRLTISLRDLRVAKLAKNTKAAPCAKEFEAFLAMSAARGDDGVPEAVKKALSACMDGRVGKSSVSSTFYFLFVETPTVHLSTNSRTVRLSVD